MSTRLNLSRRNRRISTSSSSVTVNSLPLTPDRLKLFMDYGYVAKERTPAVDFLSYLLSKTSLTTQKITHQDIQEFGETIHTNILKKCHNEKINAVKEAVQITNKQAEIHYRNEMMKAARAAEERRLEDLESQRQYYEALAERTEQNRDTLEAERKEKLILEKDLERELAVKAQAEKDELFRQECLEKALIDQKIKLKSEAALRREKSIADALKVARERFADKIEREIERTKELCEKIANAEMEKLKQLQHFEVTKLRERIVSVEAEMQEMSEKLKRAQREFWQMENEYCHFLDYTESDVTSNYLLPPRKYKHGKVNSNREKNVQTQLISLDQGNKNVQTDIKYHIVS